VSGAINNKSSDATLLRHRADVSSCNGVIGVAGFNDDDRVRGRAINCGVEHEAARRRAAHGVGRTRYARHASPDRPDIHVQDLLKVEHIRQLRR
jgi:hypothetical protein